MLAEADQAINDTCMDFSAGLSPSPFLPYSDEGRAMLQVVHDVAPGASLAFHTAVEGESDFANGIVALAAAGAKVIADDVGYFDEPFFQPSLVEQAIDQVNGQGVAYFVAAGNDGQLSYDNAAPSFTSTSGNETLLNFDSSGNTNTTTLPVTIAPAIASVTSGGLVPGEFVGNRGAVGPAIRDRCAEQRWRDQPARPVRQRRFGRWRRHHGATGSILSLAPDPTCSAMIRY